MCIALTLSWLMLFVNIYDKHFYDLDILAYIYLMLYY